MPYMPNIYWLSKSRQIKKKKVENTTKDYKTQFYALRKCINFRLAYFRKKYGTTVSRCFEGFEVDEEK